MHDIICDMDERKFQKAREQLGSQLKKTRESKKMTQSEVARLAGIHVNYFARIERGEENPSFDVLYAIAKALKVKLSELFKF